MAKECKWILKEPADPAKVERLSTEVGIDKVLAELLVKRGVETFEQARSFFRPSLDALHDPFLMKDMAKAVERLHSAIAGGEKILVYGDYDSDFVGDVLNISKDAGMPVITWVRTGTDNQKFQFNSEKVDPDHLKKQSHMV